jgi:RimJ/RimL family protein N-acetyltransferase
MIHTHRLCLRNLRESDVPAIHGWRNDPECFRYQRWEATSLEAAAAYVGKFAASRFLSTEEEQHYAICDDRGIEGDLSYFYTEEDRCVTLGITISPAHQRKGYAGMLLETAIRECREEAPRGREGLVLTCKEAKLGYYAKFGFVNEGISSSEHGGAAWYQMRIRF